MKSLVAIVTVVLTVIIASAADVTSPPSGTPKRDSAASRVQVTLISDGETWVSITNVQVPEKFRVKHITLPPGDYEVIGRRIRYRDVEKTFRVRSGEAINTLTVICTVSADSRAR
jgi:mannose-6-phosphate isomerase-like protein (cupin superfamily)